jgi:hypothetical protein
LNQETFANLLKTTKHIEYIYKIDWLTPDEQVLDEVIVDLVDGSVNFDGTKSSRRSANLTLKNLLGQYIPNPKNKMWINNKFQLWAGYNFKGYDPIVFKQGVYCLGNPSLLSTPTQKEVTIQGLDKWSLLDGTIGGKLKSKYIIPVNTRVDAIIRDLISTIAGERKFIINTCDTVLPYTIEKDVGTPIASIIEEICNIVSYEAFYDVEGWFRFQKHLEPSDYAITAPSWNYTTEGLYLESTRELMWNDVRNSILVIGDTLDTGVTVSAIAQDTSDSDLSINKISEKFEPIEDTNIYNNDLAQQRANYELSQRIMLAETVKVNIIPNFSHKENDIIEVLDASNGCFGNYVIQNLNYNISHDTQMTLGIWKIRDWR